MVRKEMAACVEGVSIRLEREYLQRIRCWSLNVDRETIVDLDLHLTAEQIALQYVQTDRRKRIENTRRSKDRRKQREDVTLDNEEEEEEEKDDDEENDNEDEMACDREQEKKEKVKKQEKKEFQPRRSTRLAS
jgi:hypothetical protein